MLDYQLNCAETAVQIVKMAFEEQLSFVGVAFITEADLKHHLRKRHFPIKLRGSHIINFFGTQDSQCMRTSKYPLTSMMILYRCSPGITILPSIFTARRNARIASAVPATAIPSVCLSHAGTVSKRLHIARCSLHCQIAKCV